MNLRTASLALALAVVALAVAQVGTLRLGEERSGRYKASVRYPTIPRGTAVQVAFNRAMATEARRQFTAFLATARPDTATKAPTAPFELDSVGTVTLNTPTLVAGVFERYDYSGGAHPNRFVETQVYGLVANQPRRLRWRDLLLDSADAVAAYRRLVLPDLNRQKRARGADPAASIEAPLADRFYLTPGAIVWRFQPYDVGPYAEGDYTVKLPKSRLIGIADPNGPLRGWLPTGPPPASPPPAPKPVAAPITSQPTEPPPAVVLPAGTLRLVGTATFRERIALPPNCRLHLRLVTLIANGPAVEHAAESVPAANPPIAFDVRFSTLGLPAGRKFVIAEVVSPTGTLFRTLDPVPLGPREGSVQLNLNLVRPR